MNSPEAIGSPEFHQFRGYLNAIQDFCSGGNSAVAFDVFAYELNGSIFSAVELLKTAYPEEQPDGAKIVECSAQSMIDDVNQTLIRSTWSFSDQSTSWDSSAYIVRYNLEGFWDQLSALIDYDGVRVFKYDDEFKFTYVWWWFTYVLVNEAQQRCVVFHGGSSD